GRQPAHGLSSRGLLLRDGYLSRVSVSERTLEFRRSAMEGLGINVPFWRDRTTLVTGATGLVGSWLVKRLRAAQADVVALVRDWVPASEVVRCGALDKVTVVRGDVRDQALME